MMKKFVLGVLFACVSLNLFAQNTIEPCASIYKIGDKGPGDGFIFYAENGEYMECSLNLGTYHWDDAISIAKNYKGGNFNDWYLPSKEELTMIYRNLKTKNLGGLFEERYWSSLEYDRYSAWGQHFRKDKQFTNGKANTHSVRAVRAF
jgi:hypothetical protein